MIKVNYTELDGPAGPTCRLEASGHAGNAPAGQAIVSAGAKAPGAACGTSRMARVWP